MLACRKRGQEGVLDCCNCRRLCLLVGRARAIACLKEKQETVLACRRRDRRECLLVGRAGVIVCL